MHRIMAGARDDIAVRQPQRLGTGPHRCDAVGIELDGGQVLHLYPNQRDRFNLRPWRNRFVLFKSPFWTVCGNVGWQLLTTVAIAKPIPARPMADVEDARDYIAGLANAIKQMPPGKAAASLLFFDLREAPPWVNREQACPSG